MIAYFCHVPTSLLTKNKDNRGTKKKQRLIFPKEIEEIFPSFRFVKAHAAFYHPGYALFFFSAAYGHKKTRVLQ
ncbi:hypothetical protein BIV59_22270 [Bacillus sp. MUM 13]|nr:hypothetical protein BIV59_22270 [Bacillus sp. MUM 13]